MWYLSFQLFEKKLYFSEFQKTRELSNRSRLIDFRLINHYHHKYDKQMKNAVIFKANRKFIIRIFFEKF